MFVGLAVGFLFAMAIIVAYWNGFKHGKSLEKGIIPQIKINPIEAIVERVEAKKIDEKQKELESEIENIMAYDGDMALDYLKQAKL